VAAGYFDDKVGPLKRAAIDAWMKSHSQGTWQIEGDRYTQDSATGGDAYVTRPNENGEGGGDWETDNFIADLFGVDRDDEFQNAFNDIRTKIDNALNPWRWIPETDDFSGDVEAMRQANSKLSVGAVIEGGKVTGGGPIGGNINLILENSDAMAGGLITAFKSDFLAQLSRAVSGQHAITIILGGHLAAQQKMWEGAKENVVTIIDDSTKAFKAAAEGGEVDWKVILKVAGFAVAGATIFATGGATKALGVTNLGLTILDAVLSANDKPTDKPAPEYQSVMDAFTRDITALDTKITDEEEIIKKNITDNLNQIRKDQGAYDLSRPALLDVKDDSDLGKEIEIKRLLVKEITDTYMPNISDALFAARTEVDKTADLTGWYRDGSIGIGSNGPSSQFHELRYLLYELLGNLGDEVKYSAKTLSLAVDDIGQRDSDAKDALEKHAEEVKEKQIGESGGAPNDPWNVVREPN
jgi:hypothetical protein